METQDIHQIVYFQAPAEAVYRILTDEDEHKKLTGTDDKIDARVGGKFRVYEDLVGSFTTLERNKLIECWWQSVEDDWPKDHYSQARFELVPKGKGTELRFRQTGVPEACTKSVSDGWRQFYWAPMQQLLEQ